jgi:2-C-methyl-D-erythritol 2,4-cyclodiphosphate synthase
MLRIGIGFDSHRFEKDRPLVLGGVTVPHDRGLSGHSDADVVVHAVIDALLGAAAAGNIGDHFPETDPAYKNADSMKLLDHIVSLLHDQEVLIQNIDAVVIAEKPRLAPYTVQMAETLAAALGIPPGCVSVKPKTNDRMGAIGAGEGIAAEAVALIEMPEGP